MLDMSAAFDVVDHGLLLGKLKLYGFEEDALLWMENYLTGRSQCVTINGELSELQPVTCGVPQGSILGPVLYCLFTNEFPEILHNEDRATAAGERTEEEVQWPPYRASQGRECSITTYADDATLSRGAKEENELSEKLSLDYTAISEYLTSNRLKINDDKTKLIVMNSGRPRVAEAASKVIIRTTTEPVQPIKSEKLLGCIIQEDLKWSCHLRDSDVNVISVLNKRIGALKTLRKVASFKQRRTLGNGIFMSKLLYCMNLWGGCSSALQVCQNRAARVITRNDWSVRNEANLGQLEWLNCKQLVFYFSALQMYKIRKFRSPASLSEMFDWRYNYRTRAAAAGLVKPVGTARLALAQDSFRWRAAANFNRIPVNITEIISLDSFKKSLKTWIMENI